jgi:purine-binding chemotaxis protein CheW
LPATPAAHPAVEADPSANLHVRFSVAGQNYGIPYQYVLEMVQPPAVAPVPGAAEAVLGVINLRGNVLGLVDLRVALGVGSAAEEALALNAELRERAREHKAWLKELEDSVREEREFALTTDPHACAFGRWFDNYDPPNVVIEQMVQRFNAPHQAIHAVAIRVHEMVAEGQAAEALRLIDQTRSGELARMITLIAELRDANTTMRRDIAIILQAEGGSKVAMLVDSVDAIEPLDVSGADSDQAASCVPDVDSGLIRGIATSETSDLVLLVDPDAIYGVFSTRA